MKKPRKTSMSFFSCFMDTHTLYFDLHFDVLFNILFDVLFDFFFDFHDPRFQFGPGSGGGTVATAGAGDVLRRRQFGH